MWEQGNLYNLPRPSFRHSVPSPPTSPQIPTQRTFIRGEYQESGIRKLFENNAKIGVSVQLWLLCTDTSKYSFAVQLSAVQSSRQILSPLIACLLDHYLINSSMYWLLIHP